MLRSDAPWAMALMLMLCRPSAPKELARDVGPSLHALANHGDDRLIGFLIERDQPCWNSSRNSSATVCAAVAASLVFTARQMVCSEEA